MTELRLAPIRGDIARERRRARAELHAAPPARLALARGCDACGWPGALLLDDDAGAYCPACGAVSSTGGG